MNSFSTVCSNPTSFQSTGLPMISQLAKQRMQIEQWFEQAWQENFPPLYTSVDLRDSGFKLAPVDTNLFPAGFNNLSMVDRTLAASAAQRIVTRIAPNCQRILIIPENHTRNLHYLENLAQLAAIFQAASFEVKLGTLHDTTLTVTTASGISLVLEKPERIADRVQIGDFVPDLIVLNNDLAEGVPPLLADLRQAIAPSLGLGWHRRLKSRHFQTYNEICEGFAKQFELDPWLLNPLFRRCGEVDFMSKQGEACLMYHTKALLTEIAARYQVYGIERKPYVVIKADAGSYGMGVLTVESAEVIPTLSRKQRSHMSKTKGNRAIQQVILQEGVPTLTRWDQMVAEPVMYLLGSQVIGGFYRVHTARNEQENLNTPGMELKPFIWDSISRSFEGTLMQDTLNSQFYAYSVVARLVALAAAKET